MVSPYVLWVITNNWQDPALLVSEVYFTENIFITQQPTAEHFLVYFSAIMCEEAYFTTSLSGHEICWYFGTETPKATSQLLMCSAKIPNFKANLSNIMMSHASKWWGIDSCAETRNSKGRYTRWPTKWEAVAQTPHIFSREEKFLAPKFLLLTIVQVFILILPKFLVERRNSWRQNSQKVLPCRHFGGRCTLGDGLPCEGPKDKLLLSTNQLLEFLLLSIFSHRVKRP
jgi:hypothetical protein